MKRWRVALCACVLALVMAFRAQAGVPAQAAEPAGVASLTELVPARAGEGKLVIGVAPGVVPPLDMSQESASGVPSLRGISIDYASAVARALGRDAQWRAYPDRAALIAALESGEIDMATGATGDDPAANLLLSRPYFPNALVYVEPLTPPDTPTHRLAYVDAQTSPQRLRQAYPSFDLAPYADTPSALLAVSQGRADAFVGAWGSTVYTISDLDLPGLNIKRIASFDVDNFCFAFAARRPDSAALRAQVDAALAALPDLFPYIVRERWQAVIAPVTLTQRIALSDEQTAWIRAHPVVTYSMLAYAPPLMFTDAGGAPAGVAIDVLDAISRMTGLRFEPRVRSLATQIRGDLTRGASAFAPYSVPIDGDMEKVVPSIPFGQGVFAIVTRVNETPLPDAAALEGKSIALPDEYPGHDFLRAHIPSLHFVDARPFDGQFRAVVKGSADATVIDMASANYAVSNPYRGKLVISGVLSTRPAPQGFLVMRDQPMLLGILNRAIAAMPPYELEAIRSRWKLAGHPETLWERRRPQVELGALLGFVLVLLLAGWALTLRVQINRRIAAERAMRAAKEDAETANRAKSTFLATMSHEIRTPMNAVLGLLELELHAPGERAATVRALTTAHHAARDLLGMIDDLLDVAKIEAQRLTLSPAPLDVHAWIASVVAIYEPAARAKGIALNLKRPEHDEAVWVMADGQRLRQVIGNLLSNAIKFTDTGAVTLDYGIAPLNDEKRALTFVTTDTGVGIPADRQATLFTPFTQAHDGGARHYGGTGLGLTICKTLVTMMSGRIEMASEMGRGTRFTVHVTLPHAPPQAAEIRTEAAERKTQRPLEGVRVLIVDDHPANRIVLDGQIRLLGGVTRVAEDGRSALALWRDARGDIDVIVTDCSMPVMSGEELAHAIRDDEAARGVPSAVPVIGLTANAQPEAAARAIEAGMTACLVKPIALDDLREALRPLTRSAVSPPAPAPVVTSKAPVFDTAVLAGFSDQATLIDTLKETNAADLAQAETAMHARNYARLRDVAHRMAGAAAVIGATPLREAGLALQDDCDRAVDEAHDVDIAASYENFRASALALDAALDAVLTRPAA